MNMSSKGKHLKDNKYIFVDDAVAGVGGTALTLEGITEPHQDEVGFIPTRDLTLTHAATLCPSMWIFGNITNLTPATIDTIVWIMQHHPFVKIEFDYGYCPYRGSIPHSTLTKQECHCPLGEHSVPHLMRLYESIHRHARYIFYMSDEQRSFHLQALNVTLSTKHLRLSSCFKKDSLHLMEKLRNSNTNGKFAIIDGNGGWHTKAKGIEESKLYGKKNKLGFDVLKTDTNAELLRLLSPYEGLLFHPIIHDTCPRITIEAKLLGLKVITTTKSQHITEEWWNKSIEEIVSYLESRPYYFWKILNE